MSDIRDRLIEILMESPYTVDSVAIADDILDEFYVLEKHDQPDVRPRCSHGGNPNKCPLSWRTRDDHRGHRCSQDPNEK